MYAFTCKVTELRRFAFAEGSDHHIQWNEFSFICLESLEEVTVSSQNDISTRILEIHEQHRLILI